MSGSAEAAFEALGHGTRRALLDRLATGPCTVGELALTVPVGRPAVSQHLKVLMAARLVAVEALGTRRVYRLEPEGLEILNAQIRRFWTASLAELKQAAESERR